MVSGIHWESWSVSSVDKQRVLYSLQSGKSSCYSQFGVSRWPFLQHSFWAVRHRLHAWHSICQRKSAASMFLQCCAEISERALIVLEGACCLPTASSSLPCSGCLQHMHLLNAGRVELWPGVTVLSLWPAGHH